MDVTIESNTRREWIDAMFSKMMKAAVLTEINSPLEIQQVEIPRPGPHDVLVKMIACGVCHTDLHISRGDWNVRPSLPRILGHEGIGRVIELGSNVNDEWVKKDDIIGVPWLNSTCRTCCFCVTDRESLCLKKVSCGFSMNGCFAEYATINAEFAVKLPSGMDPFSSAPLFCAGVTMYNALKASQVRPGQWISIVGIGGLGSVGIRYAVSMGMRVLAVVAQNDQNAVNLSKQMGAEEVYDGVAEKHAEWVKEKVGGVDASIVTVPLSVGFEQAIRSVKRGGRVVAVALPKGTVSIPMTEFIVNGIQLISANVGTRTELREALQLAKVHHITCPVQKRKLEDINQILDDMKNSRIIGRVVIDFEDN